MALKGEDFSPTRLEEDRSKDKSRVLTVRLNIEELERLEASAKLLGQERLGTVLKQLAEIGGYVIHRPETAAIISIIFNNERRNKRIGIDLVDPRFKHL